MANYLTYCHHPIMILSLQNPDLTSDSSYSISGSLPQLEVARKMEPGLLTACVDRTIAF